MQSDNIKITNTRKEDFPDILWLFEQAMKLQGQNGNKVWKDIDRAGLENDIENKLQYKITKHDDILCIFSVLYNDPWIWREKDKDDAIYLHRIVVNPGFKGQKLFEKVLNWAKRYVQQSNLKFIRMDTWADNNKLIDYYKSYGFKFIENYRTSNSLELPIQNRNLNVALLEMKVDYPVI